MDKDKAIVITVVSITVAVLGATGIIIFSKGSKNKQFLKAKADAVRQKAIKEGATRAQAEKLATLAMVEPSQRAMVEKDIAQITAGKSEQQAEAAVKQYQNKIAEENSGIVSTLSSGVSSVLDGEPQTMSRPDFDKVFEQVIDRLEGGYYHPNMMFANPEKYKKFTHSGETMFGLDRHAGHGIYYSSPRKTADVKEELKNIPTYTFVSPAAKEFWTIMDKNNASTNPKWINGYRGGDLEPRLKELAAGIMYPQYEKLSKKYLNPKARALVGVDKRLTFHFIRAIWNGAGWFKAYAEDMNKAVDSGVTDLDKLVQSAMDSRIKSVYNGKFNQAMSDGGKKIAGFINQLA